MILPVVKNIFAIGISIMLVLAQVFFTAVAPPATAAVSQPAACERCACGPGCACCVKPVDTPPPAAPAAPVNSTFQKEWRGLAAFLALKPDLPNLNLLRCPVVAAAAPPISKVPIFARNCSYLL